jgi:methyl-accepting chemotaxis protein
MADLVNPTTPTPAPIDPKQITDWKALGGAIAEATKDYDKYGKISDKVAKKVTKLARGAAGLRDKIEDVADSYSVFSEAAQEAFSEVNDSYNKIAASMKKKSLSGKLDAKSIVE